MSADSIPMPSTTTIQALHDHTKHDIASILERPVNLGTYAWSSDKPQLPITLNYNAYVADTQNYLEKFDFPQAIFQNSPLAVQKLQNYQYLVMILL